MFCKITTDELKKVSVGSDALNMMSPRQRNEHNEQLDAVLKRAVQREPHKFQEKAFIWQVK
jgi:hypothetical protein